MIAAARFLVTSAERPAWLEARKQGVTATEVSYAATPYGFTKAIEKRILGSTLHPSAAMEWGTAREPDIARAVKELHGVWPNDWLIRHETDPRWLATPDGISADHLTIGEYKTTGAVRRSIPRDHVDQMQWQMFVTGAQHGLYAWLTRADTPYGSVPRELTPHILPIERDNDRISFLVDVAERLLRETDALNAAH